MTCTMKYHFLAALNLVILLAACSALHREAPDEPPPEGRLLILPSQTLAKKSGSSLKELHIGFGIWMRECGKCHAHIFPDDVSIATWHASTPRMAWNTNITDKEQKALLNYILAVKSEPSEFSKQLEKLAKESQ